MYDFLQLGVAPASVLLPKDTYPLSRWAVVACDQFTSEPAYWEAVRREAGSDPSTLHIIYPECYLGEEQGERRILSIRETMREYRSNVLRRACVGFVLVERETIAGTRLGLLMAADLEKYDFSPTSRSLIRATEQTIEARIPPRVKIRMGAPIESSHILLLADDPRQTLIAPLYQERDGMRKLYEFDLMQKGGRIRGWAVEGKALDRVRGALSGLYERCEGLLFAVGDGNHSLATARQCWLEMRASLSERERADHPARFALCEVVNLHDPALRFEPIHRAVFGADPAGLSHDFVVWCQKKGMNVSASDDLAADMYLLDAPVRLDNPINPLPVAALQLFLDEWLADHPGASIDYIHGEGALRALAEGGACCVRLKPIDKHALFASVRKGGSLPRKTFSLGEARDKRYYLECRNLTRC